MRVMVMTLHKLTAGDGYLYLVRQVAAADDTQRGRSTLADYYSAKGEAPGRWLGRGLAALSETSGTDIDSHVRHDIWSVEAGSDVGEEQMRALFGEGLHPNADRIERFVAGRGVGSQRTAGRLGRKFYVRDGEPEFTRRLAVAYREHNTAAGAQWNTTIDADLRARLRTGIAVDMFGEQYARPPADDRELSGFIARNTRARTTAVAGYDLTFSPVKSVSALWAIAPLTVAEKIETAHDAAVAEVLDWLQDHAAFTRLGTNGVAQVDTEGLIAAAFTHRDSRAGDPDLHTHIAVSNKVCHVDANGVRRWLALDGQPLHRTVVAASELYNTRLEAHLSSSLGVSFTEKSRGAGKRPVREIVGLPGELLSRWSSRRAMIEGRTAELAKQFQTDHGREPTHVEIIALAQQATLETREDKHEPRSLAQQRATWRNQAVEVLGRDGVQRMLADILDHPARQYRVPVTDDRWVSARADEIIATVAQNRATWQRHHVRAEALRVVRHHNVSHNVGLVDRITDTALSESFSVPHASVGDGLLGEPVALRRRDGASVYTRHGTQTFTSRDILAAERRILTAVARVDGRCATDLDVEFARADAELRGRTLNPGQVALVAEMATCGRRLALALAPAGTGKTTAMAALAHAWRSSGGHVLGLAPTAEAAIVLDEDLKSRTDTIDKYVHTIDQPANAQPSWFRRVGPDTLIIVDEAGKASTVGLDRLIADALSKGASVRLIGDDGQLSSISAGGVLRDIADATDALTLTEVVRFKSPAEAAAGLALHDADPAGIAFYIDHHRIHVGTEDTAADMAYRAWRDDLAAGTDSILLAPTNDIITTLNARARADRIATTPHAQHQPTVVLSDGLHASVGDTIRTRRNNRRIPIGRDDYVRNGYRYTITDVRPDGAIVAHHLRSGRHVTLPAGYLAEHVTLGYAATIDSAQGLTAGSRTTTGTCHIVGSDQLTRQHLYVAMTRGTDENHLYLSTAEADPHRLLSPKATHPDTAVDVLTRVLARDGAQVSATTAARQAADPATRLHAAADMFYDALGVAAEHHLGPRTRDHLDTLADTVLPELSTREAWPVLRRRLALHAVEGADPRQLLTDALAKGDIHNAADPAAVLDYRIDPAGAHSAGVGVLRWLPAIPASLTHDPHWGDYLARRQALVEDLANDIRARARDWTHATAPAWARPLITVNTALTAEIAVLRCATGVPDSDTRLTGAPQRPVRTRAVQTLLQRHAAAGISRHSADTTRWNDLIDHLDPRLRADAYWPQLATKLAHAARSTPHFRETLINAAHQKPLPDEQPAAALWWRIVGALSPTTTLATTHSRLRPAWLRDLDDTFGTALAETICADPAWPGLVAAISAADPSAWTPRDLLQLAAERLADGDEPIPAADYARLITYTVDAFTHRPALHPGTDQVPLPDDAPDDPFEEEALFPPDPAHPAPPHDTATRFDLQNLPTEVGQVYEYGTGPIDGLRFEDLTTTAPDREPLVTIELLHSLQQQYRTASEQLNILDGQIKADNGPAMSAAAEDLARMRRQADADRPYRHAVTEIVAQWSDADAAFNNALLMVKHAQNRLLSLRADPDADELDIASAQADLAFHNTFLPDTDPATQFQPLIENARAARALAAGGEPIATERDIDTLRNTARNEDLAARTALRARRDTLTTQIKRAERDIARAFASAHTAAETALEKLREPAETELDILRAARHVDIEHAPLAITDASLEPINSTIAAQLKTLAAQPYLVGYLHADSSHPGTAAALHALRAGANNSDRKVLWLSTNENITDEDSRLDAADSTFTLDNSTDSLAEVLRAQGPHTIVLIDNPTHTHPGHLADVLRCVTANNARAIILDPSTSTPGPASSALRLLATTLPWATQLGPTDHRRAANPTPAITLAAGHDRTRLGNDWRHLLNDYDTATRAIRSAHRLQLTLSWNTPRHDREQDLDASIDD
ncbi:AAA family ATPase [Mycolicibacterium sp. 018/SC-01/001]|nr:AAA family ATPase [Mycolicibacterium sp. 018/SC-01/001]